MDEETTIDITDVNELCRICGSRLSLVLAFSIFDKEGSMRQIFEKILACLPIKVSSDDKLPKLICEECVYKLDLLYDFREKSIKTENFLNELVSKVFIPLQHVETNVTSDIIESVVVPTDSQLIPDSDISTTFIDNFNPNHVIEVHPVIVTSTVEVTTENEMGFSASECKDFTFIKIDSNTYTQEECITEIQETNSDADSEGVIVSGGVIEDKGDTDSEEEEEVKFVNVGETAGENGSELQEIAPTKFEDIELTENGSDTWFSCDVCAKIFQNKESFQKHYEQHWCRCVSCGLVFADNDSLFLHCQQSHPDDEKVLTQSTENSEGNSSKKTKGVKEEVKPCPHCGKKCRSNFKLNEHMRKHTGEKPYQCQMCDKSFRSKIGLAQHEAKHTGNFEFACNTCGKGFQCKSYLIVHQRVHSDVKPYPCTTCGRNFKTKQSLLDHQNRHLGVKPYTCEICGRGFITKGLCKSHQKVHSGVDNRQYPCTVCNKLFVSKSYLNTHMRIHTGEKPYICEVCGKGFLTRVDLRIHSTMHTGEKSFVCETCGKAFARRDALRCHKRSHTGERPYRCEICGQTFTQFSPMAIHKRLHTGERPYECEVCRKRFVSRSTMMAHFKKHAP